jgi:hypothetical protein
MWKVPVYCGAAELPYLTGPLGLSPARSDGRWLSGARVAGNAEPRD